MNTNDYQDATLIDLTIKFLSGDISREEMSQLAVLLEENPNNRNTFDELKRSWDASGSYPAEESQNQTLHSWEQVRYNLSTSNSNKEEKETRTLGWSKFFRVAAVWIFLVSLGSFATWYISRSGKASDGSKLCIVSTPLGSKSHMVLPDGSDVWLNAGTTLQYPSVFTSKQRDIYLTGEAYFKVASNKKWPFIVHTTELNIKAVGTSFNVKAYPTEKTVTTTLVEGIVKLESAIRNFSYTLKPKQELVFLKEYASKKKAATAEERTKSNMEDNTKLLSIQNALVKNEINTDNSVSWKDKRWIIQGETIEDLSVMLERRYDIKIRIVSEELNQFKFSGTIENETIEQVLNYLRYTIPMKYTIMKGFVELKIDNALKEKYKGFLKKETDSVSY